MSQSEMINELATALSKAQGEFSHILKNKKVQFAQTKYDYADLAGCFDTCREALSKNGLSIVQPMEMLGSTWVVVTKLMHSSGQWIDSMLPISVEGKPQDIGSKITYMRKYQLWSILGLATEDDDGQGEAKRKHEENSNPNNNEIQAQEEIKYIGDMEFTTLTNLTKKLDKESHKIFFTWIKDTFNAHSIRDIPKVAFDKCMLSLNARIKYLKDQEKSKAVA